MGQYAQEAYSDAVEMLKEYRDEVMQQLTDSGEASTDLFNDYDNGDSYHHETHVDKDYNLTEAAELLSDLREYEESDSGLWEGQEPRRAIATQAAFTYGNAVLHWWLEMIREVNEAFTERMDEEHPEAEGDEEHDARAKKAAESAVDYVISDNYGDRL